MWKVGQWLSHCLQSALHFPAPFPVAHHVCWDGNKYEQGWQQHSFLHVFAPCGPSVPTTKLSSTYCCCGVGSGRLLWRSRVSKITETFCGGYKEKGSYKAFLLKVRYVTEEGWLVPVAQVWMVICLSTLPIRFCAGALQTRGSSIL